MKNATVMLERVPKKLIDFFDGNTLYFSEKRAISYRPDESIRSESALAGRRGPRPSCPASIFIGFGILLLLIAVAVAVPGYGGMRQKHAVDRVSPPLSREKRKRDADRPGEGKGIGQGGDEGVSGSSIGPGAKGAVIPGH